MCCPRPSRTKRSPCGGQKERHMIGTIIGAIIVGAIIGALGRLIQHGRQHISLVVTILIGIVANVLVTFDVRQICYSNGSGIAWIPLNRGAIVAAIITVL